MAAIASVRIIAGLARAAGRKTRSVGDVVVAVEARPSKIQHCAEVLKRAQHHPADMRGNNGHQCVSQ